MNKPKFILSKKIVLSQYNKISAIADTISYSSKTNPLITPILEKETNAQFSVHLFNELKNVKDKSRVLFLAQALNQDSIAQLIEMGVASFVVDNESDLREIVSYSNSHNVQINLLLRLKLKENSIKTERYFVFGMTSDVVEKHIKELRQNKNIVKLGIHFHRKSQNMSEWNLIYELSNTFSDELFNLIDVMCIGGGIPAEYANTNVDVIDVIFKRITEFRTWLHERKVNLIIEPGRYIAAPSVVLKTEIIGIHENNIIVNASVYNSDMDALIVPVKLLIAEEVSKEKGKPYAVKGITPCSMDLFRYRVYLENPRIGDVLTFLNAGAYNFSTDFCDLDVIETEIVD